MPSSPSKLVIVSGLSGSGKSVALNALEDFGYFCVDNLPLDVLPAFLDSVRAQREAYRHVAIGIDARSRNEDPERWTALLDNQPQEVDFRLLFLTADDETLIKRFSETRRRHPLTGDGSLAEAIDKEKRLLQPLEQRAAWVIDTSTSNIHQLRHQVWKKVGGIDESQITSVVLESFAFKHGVPPDVDLLFDARCLPNPHWDPELRPHTGLETEVATFLDGDPQVQSFYNDVLGFMRTWLPHYTENQRGYLTIGIGCTGGRHRSTYLTKKLAEALREDGYKTVVHHRELEKPAS